MSCHQQYALLNNVAPASSVGRGVVSVVDVRVLDTEREPGGVLDASAGVEADESRSVGVVCSSSAVVGLGVLDARLRSALVSCCRFPWPRAPAAVRLDNKTRQSRARRQEGRSCLIIALSLTERNEETGPVDHS
jgi:hypothetical protein